MLIGQLVENEKPDIMAGELVFRSDVTESGDKVLHVNELNNVRGIGFKVNSKAGNVTGKINAADSYNKKIPPGLTGFKHILQRNIISFLLLS